MKRLESKRKKIFSQSQIGSELDTPSMLSQAMYIPTLAFTSCLHGAQRVDRGTCLRSTQFFSEHASSPEHVCFTSDFPIFIPDSFVPPKSPPRQPPVS